MCQLVEKAREHHSKEFLLFVDLKKVYDSVHHAALWHALRKLGVPNLINDNVQSFHKGMKEAVQVTRRLLQRMKWTTI